MTNPELIRSPRDWVEDFSHENGNYVCQCCMCEKTFLGHKRRVVCQLCSEREKTMIEFKPFPKIPRLSRDCVITEKIDGTNASITILDPKAPEGIPPEAMIVTYGIYQFAIVAGSRRRFITTGKDNAGFARWVLDNAEALVLELGYGTHFGEWWGAGIQRKYGLVNEDKRFSLFNTSRWAEDEQRKLCHVVPTLYEGEFCTLNIEDVLYNLRDTGSMAAPGFMEPEGIVIFHKAGNLLFKKTIDGDESWKG